MPTTIISLSKSGYLFNEASGQFLEKEDAFKVWQYLYQKQEIAIEHAKKIIEAGAAGAA